MMFKTLIPMHQSTTAEQSAEQSAEPTKLEIASNNASNIIAAEVIINKMKEEKAQLLKEKIAKDALEKYQQSSWETIKLNPEDLLKVSDLTEVDESIYPYLDQCINLKSITFANNFNSMINLSKLSKLKKLTTGTMFNQSFKDNLPLGLTSLNLGLNYIRKIDNLCDSIEELTFDNRFNTTVILPKKLKSLSFGDSFNTDLELPNTLEKLSFGFHFNKSLKLPKSLRKLQLSNRFNYDIILNDGLQELTLGLQFNKNLVLPESMEILRIRNKDILSKITLNKRVKVITI